MENLESLEELEGSEHSSGCLPAWLPGRRAPRKLARWCVVGLVEKFEAHELSRLVYIYDFVQVNLTSQTSCIKL